jgi:hypothetical protein
VAPFISVLHVDELGTVDWHAVAGHAPMTAGRLVEPGDIIVSLLNPAKLRAAVIPPPNLELPDEIQVSAEFGVFRADCDPYAVLGMLYSAPVRAQLVPLGRGTSSSRRRIDMTDVLGLVVPKLSVEALRALARAVRDGERLVNEGRAKLRRQFASLDPAGDGPAAASDTEADRARASSG